MKARASESNVNDRKGSSSGDSQAKKTMSLRETLAEKAKVQPRLGDPPIAWESDGMPKSYPSRRHSTSSFHSNPTSGYISSSGPGQDPTIEKGSSESRLIRCASILRERHDRSAVDLVMSDIVQRDMGVKFDDIAALDTAKRLLNEAVVLPLMMPELFTGIREPWKVVITLYSSLIFDN